MKAPITRELLGLYESVSGELERLTDQDRIDRGAWELLDELLLDLHLIRHGYADEGFARHVERRLGTLCEDDRVADRIRQMWR